MHAPMLRLHPRRRHTYTRLHYRRHNPKRQIQDVSSRRLSIAKLHYRVDIFKKKVTVFNRHPERSRGIWPRKDIVQSFFTEHLFIF